MKKLTAFLILFLLIILPANSKNIDKKIDSQIKNSGISKSSIAISVKDIDRDKVVYSLNDKVLMHPASVQKLLTTVPVADILGKKYELSTKLYKRGTDGYLIKLGADPYLTTSDLNTLIKKIPSDKIKTIFIDDSIIESKDWGEGWQWDDDLNTSMPRFNSYNLDGNIYKLTIMPTEQNKQALIINQNKVPIGFYNNVITGDCNDISISRDNINSPNLLNITGTVSSPVIKSIPNNNLKKYFNYKLKTTLEDNKIYLKNQYLVSKINSKDKLLDEVKHPIDTAIKDILLNSNNMTIETLAKLASGKFYNKQGTDSDAINMYKEFYKKQNLDDTRIRLVDSSGVSKNNLTDTDFISEFLIKNKDNAVLNYMASPGEGTLSNRMIPLKNNLKAKTGTLSDISSIAGFITTKNGHNYAFCIIINDPSSTNSHKKSLEDYIIREIYFNI